MRFARADVSEVSTTGAPQRSSSVVPHVTNLKTICEGAKILFTPATKSRILDFEFSMHFCEAFAGPTSLRVARRPYSGIINPDNVAPVGPIGAIQDVHRSGR